MRRRERTGRWKIFSLGAVAVGVGSGCGDLFRNQTASLGGPTAGSRGSVRVLVINNTDQRAVFTMGTFDPTDRLTEADFEQFGLRDRERTLDGGEASDIVSIRCGRVFGIGSPGLIEAVPAESEPGSISDEALVEGVTFFDVSDSSGGGDSDPVEVGTANPIEPLLGVDFSCGSILVVYLEPADVGDNAFRIDFRVIPAESAR